jgi:hypothetical protein
MFGGALFMLLGLSLEKLHEAHAETLPGRGWGVRRHCLERRARASRNFASSGPHPCEGHGDNAGRNGEGDHRSRREATHCHVPVCQGIWILKPSSRRRPVALAPRPLHRSELMLLSHSRTRARLHLTAHRAVPVSVVRFNLQHKRTRKRARC